MQSLHPVIVACSTQSSRTKPRSGSFGVLFAALAHTACTAGSPNTPTLTDASVVSESTLDASSPTQSDSSKPNETSATPGDGSSTSTRDTSPTTETTNQTVATNGTRDVDPTGSVSSLPSETSTVTEAESGTRNESSSAQSTAITSSQPPEPNTGPSIREGRLFVDGAPFQIKGVNWNPVPVGATHPQGLDYTGSVANDAALMQAAGINAVRTYEHLADTLVLDVLYEHGIYVFTTVYGWWQDDPGVVTERVNAVKDHKAVLGYVLGNEWNYNQLYSNGGITTVQTRDQLNAAAALVKQADPTKVVCTIYGELGDLQTMVESMPDIDLWGINAYRGIGFGDLFDAYAAISTKPMFLGEFGADAYNANIDAYDPDSQAQATSALIGEIAVAFADSKTLGGFIFEWNDEWWKDGEGSPNEQDVGGIAPGGGPHPDATFNEEWWGIVDINREPRPAYAALQAAYTL